MAEVGSAFQNVYKQSRQSKSARIISEGASNAEERRYDFKGQTESLKIARVRCSVYSAPEVR